jgi:hypothetical protein
VRPADGFVAEDEGFIGEGEKAVDSRRGRTIPAAPDAAFYAPVAACDQSGVPGALGALEFMSGRAGGRS